MADRLNMVERMAQQAEFAAMVHYDAEEDDLAHPGYPLSGHGSHGSLDLDDSDSMVVDMDGAESVASTGIGLTGRYLRPPQVVPPPKPPAAAPAPRAPLTSHQA